MTDDAASVGYDQLWRDYFALTGALALYERKMGVRTPELYESLYRLLEAALTREDVQASIGTAA